MSKPNDEEFFHKALLVLGPCSFRSGQASSRQCQYFEDFDRLALECGYKWEEIRVGGCHELFHRYWKYWRRVRPEVKDLKYDSYD